MDVQVFLWPPGDDEGEGSSSSSTVYGSSYVPSTERRRGRGRHRNRGRGRNRHSSSSSSVRTSSVTGSDGVVRETVSRTSYGSPGSGVQNDSYSYTNTYRRPSSSSSSSTDASSSSGPALVDQSYFNRRRGESEDGDYFRWNGGGRSGGTVSGSNTASTISRRIKTTKTTTTTTQTRPGSTTRFTYTLPGITGTSTFRNTTTYTSSSSSGRGGVAGYGGSSSGGGGGVQITDSRIETVRRYGSRGQGREEGFGETYRKNTEEEVVETQEYEEEGYSEEFARGPYISEQDRLHPLVFRGFGKSPGRIGDDGPPALISSSQVWRLWSDMH